MTDSAAASTTVYVISGANRGLGYGVVEQLASRTDAVIYAGARNPAKADKLQQLAKQHSNVHVVQLQADSEEDHKALAARVEKETGRADVVWANAGICAVETWAPVAQYSIAAIREHLDVNTFHPLIMYQAFHTLLSRSSNPKFIVSSSASGSTGLLEQLGAIPQLAYGISKAAVNNLTRRIHFENTTITALPIHPGWVQTDMGNAGARALKLAEAPMKFEDSITKIVQLLDTATRESHGGKYWNVETDSELPW